MRTVLFSVKAVLHFSIFFSRYTGGIAGALVAALFLDVSMANRIEPATAIKIEPISTLT